VLQFAFRRSFSYFATPQSALPLRHLIVGEKGGKSRCLECLLEAGQTANEAVFLQAVISGHLPCLKVLHAHHCPVLDAVGMCHELAEMSAEPRYFECLKHCPELGLPWSVNCTVAVASRGNLEALKFLHENGCAWNEGVCDAAVQENHFDCLKYAHENGCPWQNELILPNMEFGMWFYRAPISVAAVRSGDLECLR